MIRLGMVFAAAVLMSVSGGASHAKMTMQTFPVLAGAGPHDVYPAPDGTVWFTAQSAGKLGRLDPKTGKSDLMALGPGAAPHGVIVGPDGAAWVTEGGQNAIARVDPATREVKLFPLPKERRNANLNTATFDRRDVLWFTGQNGIYGRLDPKSGTICYSMPHEAPALTASPPRRMARCSSRRSPAVTSVRSISRPAPPRSWNRPSHAKAPGASGATAAAGCGLPAGTAVICSATTARPGVGHDGTCPATGRSPMPFMSTRPMRCGSATGVRTRSCASTPRPRNSSPSRYPIATRTYGSSRAARAKSGAPNPGLTSSSC